MLRNQVKPLSSERIIFAPEGFIDERYLPRLLNDDVRIIEVRVLSDGPVFHTVRRYPLNS